MRTATRIGRAAFLAIIIATVAAGVASAQTAQQIIDRADQTFTMNRVWSRSVMTITRGGREQAPQEMETYALTDGDTTMSLAVFTAPARVRGTAYLTVGDDLWVRFSSTGRVRKLSSSARSNAAAGSDFSYSDMGDGSSSFTDRYTPQLNGRTRIDGQECFRIDLTPTDRSAPYDGLTVYVTTDDYHYVQVDYFEQGTNVKTMTLSDYRPVGSLSYPFVVTMTSHEQDSITTITTEEMEADSARVRPDMFSVQYLGTIR